MKKISTQIQTATARRHYSQMVQSLILLAVISLFPMAHAADPDSNPHVKMTTNLGEMVIELYPEKAPASVENFLQYVNDGHYNGTIFHRVIEGFMIQGGGFTLNFDKKETREPITNEADNGLTNDHYTIAMARTQAPHSATAQFFINTADNNFLNHRSKDAAGWGYTVFGKLIEGQKIADWLAKVPTGAAGPFPKDVPSSPIVIESVETLTSSNTETKTE